MTRDPKRSLLALAGLGAAGALLLVAFQRTFPADVAASKRAAGPTPIDEAARPAGPSGARLAGPLQAPSGRLSRAALTDEPPEPLPFHHGENGRAVAGRVVGELPWPPEHLAVSVLGWKRTGRLYGAHCDAGGHFRVTGLPHPALGLRGAETYRLELRHAQPGTTFPGRLAPVVEAEVGATDVVLRASAPAQMLLRPVDAEIGEPLAERVSRVMVWTWRGDFYQERELRPHRDGALLQVDSGSLRLGPLAVGASGASVGLEVVVPDYRPLVVAPRPVGPGARLELGRRELRPPAPLVVRVVDADGRPVWRATVHLTVDGLDAYARPLHESGQRIARDIEATLTDWTDAQRLSFERARDEWHARGGPYAEERTDDEGLARLELRHPVPHVLWATSRGALGAREVRLGPVAARPEQRAGGVVELRLLYGGTVEVSVTETDGRPIPGVPIFESLVRPEHPDEAAWSDEEHADRLPAVTDASGGARGVGFPPGLYHIRAGPVPGHEDAGSPFGEGVLVRVVEGGEHAVPFVAPPRFDLCGRVTDGRLRVAGAAVVLTPEGGSGRVGFTDEDGEFCFARVSAPEGVLRCEHPGDGRVVSRPYRMGLWNEWVPIELDREPATD